jgi:hypothetical protein
MREYKIVKSDLGRNIYKKREKDWKISLRFLGWNNKRVLNKSYAKTFYHREDALAALVIVKMKNEKKSD